MSVFWRLDLQLPNLFYASIYSQKYSTLKLIGEKISISTKIIH